MSAEESEATTVGASRRAFRFALTLRKGAVDGHPAFLRVAGVPVALRLLRSAMRAGASEIVVVGPSEIRAAVHARVRRERVGGTVTLYFGSAPPSALPVIEAPAETEIPSVAWAALLRADGPVFLPEAPEVTRRGEGASRPLVRPPSRRPSKALRVRSPAEAQRATRHVFRHLGREGASLIARANGLISRLITRALVETRLRPSLITAAHTSVGLLSAWLFSLGGLPSLFVAGLLFDTASILDGVDGELARAKLLDSSKGAGIDTLGDDLVYLAFAVALPVGYARFAAERGLPWAPYVLALGVALSGAAAILVVGMAGHALRHDLGGSMSGLVDDLAPAREPLPLRIIRRALVALGRRACFARLIAVLAVLAATTGAHGFYDLLFFGTTFVVIALAAGFVCATIRAPKRLRKASAALRVRLDRENADRHRARRGKS
jgi:CDP-L-myo-inositol myo-inositolphosphotransferase